MKETRILIVLAWMLASVSEDVRGEASPGFEGIFKGESITVELEARDDSSEGGGKSGGKGQFKGKIQRGDLTFALTARQEGDRLRGTFEHQDTRFPFAATLSGDSLVLTTGSTTYTLERQIVVPNPLERPGPAPRKRTASTPTAGVPPTAAASRDRARGILRFRKVSVKDRDDMIGGEAATFLAPVDYKVEGGVQWRLHPAMPAGLAVRAFNPAGLEAVESFPAQPFSWGGYLGPGTMFPPGSNYMGNEVRPPPRDAVDCLKNVLVPRFRGKHSPRLGRAELLPELAKEVKAQNPDQPNARATVSAARVRIQYHVGGKPVEEDLYCALIITRVPMLTPGRDLTIWVADRLIAMRAEKGKLEEATKILQTCVNSARPNLQWFNRYTQLVQTLIRMQMQQIRNAGQISKIISRTSSEISDMMMKTYQERQASEDRIHKRYSQYIRGVDEYYDPVGRNAVELPSGYDRAWVNGLGEYIVTDDPNFNPQVELDGNWKKLQKKAE